MRDLNDYQKDVVLEDCYRHFCGRPAKDHFYLFDSVEESEAEKKPIYEDEEEWLPF